MAKRTVPRVIDHGRRQGQNRLDKARGQQRHHKLAPRPRELEERQFLVRTPDEHDRRVWRLTVTAEGEDKSQWFRAIEAGLATDIFGGLADKERAQIALLLKGLRARISGLAEEA